MVIKHFKKTVFSAVLAFLLFPHLLWAQQKGMKELLNEAAGSEGAGYATVNTKTGFATLLGTITKTVLSFLGVVFIIYIIYGGWLWLTAAGNEEKVERSKKIIRDGIIGIIIILSAASIYWLLKTVLISGGAGGVSGGG